MRENIRIHILIALLTLLSTSTIQAQRPPGYIGKKNIIGLSFTGGIRFFSGTFNSFDKTVYDPEMDESGLTRSRNIFRSGFNAEYFRIIGRNIGVGLKFQYNKISLSSSNDLREFQHDNGNQFFDYYNITTTSAEFSSFAFKPTIVFNSKPGFLPIGLRHTISVGGRFVSLNDNIDYFYRGYITNNNSSDDEQGLIQKPNEDFSNQLSGIDIGYNGSITYPVTDFLMIELGYEFRFSWLLEISQDLSANRSFFQDDDSVESSLSEAYYNRNYSTIIRNEVLGRIFSMNVGLVFAL